MTDMMFTEAQLRKTVKEVMAKLIAGATNQEKVIAETLVANGIPASTWPLVNLAFHWANDLEAWADGEMDVFDPITGKDGLDPDTLQGDNDNE